MLEYKDLERLILLINVVKSKNVDGVSLDDEHSIGLSALVQKIAKRFRVYDLDFS